MPVVKVLTNLTRAQVPQNFVVNFNKFLAPLLNKGLDKVVTAIHTDQSVTTGDDEKYPMVLLRVWSFNVFGDLEKRNHYSVEIYRYLRQQFPELSYDNFKVLLHDMPQVDVGPKPQE